MKLLSLFFLFAIGFSGCASVAKNNAHYAANGKTRRVASGTQPRSLNIGGEIIALGGESDIYFLQNTQFGKVKLTHGNSNAYTAIRDHVGEMMDVTGNWKTPPGQGEAEFVAFSVREQIPVEGTTLEGVIQSLGGESDTYFIQHASLGKVFLDHRGSKPYDQIRGNVGKRVRMAGSWNEREDQKLIFIVNRLVVSK